MNFVKRAGLSLWARKGRTLITFATFLVISLMVLAGVLINAATARAELDAERSVGAEVTLAMDPQAQGNMGQAPTIDSAVVEKIGELPQVEKYTYSMWDRVLLKGEVGLVTDGGEGAMGPGGTAGIGLLDSSLLTDFRSGRFKLLSGKHLTAADKDTRRILVEERLAGKNGLKTGDKVTLTGNDEKTTGQFTVAGIFRDPRPDTELEPEYGVNPANMIYGTVGGLATLNASGGGAQRITRAGFLLRDPDDQEVFRDEAERLAGSALEGFALDVNDKAVQQMTGPLRSISSTATLAMWLIGLAGAAVLTLLVNLAVKQRRREYGVLVSLGEKKWKLITQQALEITAVAALAIALGSVIAPRLTQSAGQSLLGREAASAQQRIDAWQPPPPGSTGLDEGIDPDDQPVENADPIDRITVVLEPANLALVGGVGLGIGLLAAAIPAASVLRLSPRSILTNGK
ncbi:putative ABC transport system permease protein [Streptomyces sp. SAI-135]|uniref:ABC transporter permease n=1 Tax=unclassified Streptomyces TaxID=2593676 RepID=UPI00247644EC|nr:MULTISPECIES: ABC transporter permease [unclassified Streptomyces]MDH6514204.1 putative ABC transport system permease protein [Streptomyces sp. SAI-090]MDH6621716.1 putative ABC transport system permease protein [Streptomyces sp. SAI-135]